MVWPMGPVAWSVCVWVSVCVQLCLWVWDERSNRERWRKRKKWVCLMVWQVEGAREKEIISIKADGERKRLKFEATESQRVKELTMWRERGANLTVNGSKEERTRYLREGRWGGVCGGNGAQGFGWNVMRLLLSGDQFLHYSLLPPLPSSHGISAESWWS